jgi:hypothetical protein
MPKEIHDSGVSHVRFSGSLARFSVDNRLSREQTSRKTVPLPSGHSKHSENLERRNRMKNTPPTSKLIAALSRRRFFGRAAGVGGAFLLSSSIPGKVWADEESRCDSPGLCDFPLPIPHINVPPPGGAHFYFPGPVDGSSVPTDPSGVHPEGRDPIVIFNFRGFIGAADLGLTGTGTDLTTGEMAPYQFHADMRFMHGRFVGTDGIERRASFAFV